MDSQQTPNRGNSLTSPPTEDNPPHDESVASEENGRTRFLMYLVLFVLGLVMLQRGMGTENLLNIVKVGLGLGFLIFVHELGHFVVAKWCDVHVEAFSIGFGPALPGCSFRRGETVYKISLLPLGGYVKMVGEGPDGEEEDHDPRSFKNKSVSQRMAIISAGVTMNLIFGCLFFIIAYRSGVEQPAADVGIIDAGSPAWQKGIPTGAVFQRIGKDDNPYFEHLKYAVMLSMAGEQIQFVYAKPGQEPHTVDITPRLSKTDKNPVIGYQPVFDLKLPPKPRRDLDKRPWPTLYNTPAAAARQLDLLPGDRILATTDPDDEDHLKDLPAAKPGEPWNFAEFSKRLLRLTSKRLVIRVQRQSSMGNAKPEEVEVPLTGFDFDDSIVGTTDDRDNQPYDPFRVKPLPVDVRDPQHRHLDIYEFGRRLQVLADKPVVIQIRRHNATQDEQLASVYVPASYHFTLPGLQMEMGLVAALRDGSPAAEQVRPGDTITRVQLTDGNKGDSLVFADSSVKSGAHTKPLDPLRLPDEMRRWARSRAKVKVTLTVRRPNPVNHTIEEKKLSPLPWDRTWDFDQEIPLITSSPMAIPELGIAYYVKTRVDKVAPDSVAAKAGLSEEDVILDVTFKAPGNPAQSKWQEKTVKLWTKQDSDEHHPEAWWAHVFQYIQESDSKEVQLHVRHVDGQSKETVDKVISVTFEPDLTWPLYDARSPRGLMLLPFQYRTQKADDLAQAVVLGLDYTWRKINQVYRGLQSFVARRLSATDNMQGPIGIAVTSFVVAGQDLPTFLLFLGMISVNLAVINFLPIPILDGGHMVFLLYEKIRGKPASIQVQAAATYIGLVLLLSLMVFAVYVDVKRIFF